MTKQWTLIGQTVTDHIKVPPTATHDNITRLLNNVNNDWSSIAKIVNKYEIKNGTHNSVIQRIRDIKSGKITDLSQITGGSTTSSSSSSSSSGDSTSTSSSDNSGGNASSSVKKVKITDPQEALDFALTEWNKIRRTSGHQLECQVFGSNHWKVGEWCKVYIPSINEYTDMYITKIDNSNDSGSEWLTNLTLMDYAPSLSEPEETEEEETTSDDASATSGGDASATGGGSSKWTEIVKVLEENYEKPSTGWDDIVRTIQGATTYDPTIRNAITSLKQKSSKSYVQVGHELCNIVGIGY